MLIVGEAGFEPAIPKARRFKLRVYTSSTTPPEVMLDTSHFLGQGHNRGKEALNQRPIEDYLSNKARTRSSKLRERLIWERYFEHQCSSCKRRTWLGRPIPLELDHISGDSEDNDLENLRLLCPNCHARTPTYRRSKASLVG